MRVHINGGDHDLPEAASVADAVSAVTPAPRGVAVAVNGEVAPRATWASTTLRPGDRVEVLIAVQGG